MFFTLSSIKFQKFEHGFFFIESEGCYDNEFCNNA